MPAQDRRIDHLADDFWSHSLEVVRPALVLAPPTFITDIRRGLTSSGVQGAIASRETGPIYDHLLRTIQYQGISDAAAEAFVDAHGLPSWSEINNALARRTCPLLRSHWDFSGCGFRKASGWCSQPEHLAACFVPELPLRKGDLSQAAVSLALFIRDVAGGDLTEWLDVQVAGADGAGSAVDRAARFREAILKPISNIHGVSLKVGALMLANLLLGADPPRRHWREAGASMVVVDTLVHAHLHRTGILRRAGAEHAYGPRCYSEGGCASILEGLAERIDARRFNRSFPRFFPRFVQHAIWRFCAAQGGAQGGLNVCNGNQIDDRERCRNVHCPSFGACDRVPLRDW